MTAWKLTRPAFAALLAVSFAVLLVLYLTAGHQAMQSATVLGKAEDFWSVWRTTKRVLITGGLVAGTLYAAGLVEQRKIVAVYLRRFLMNTEVINPQHAGGLGRSVRLVTLQDQTFPPYAISAKDTALSLVVPLTLIALVFVGTNELNSAALPIVSDDNEQFWRTHILYSHYVAWWALTLMLLATFHRVRLHLRQTMSVRRPEDAACAAAMAYSQSSPWKRPSLLGMRSTVVETTDALWKETVTQLLGTAQVVVIDVSELSESVLWELQQLADLRLPTLLIGTHAGLAATADAAARGQLAARLADFLNDCDQLAFDQADARSLRTFRVELTQALRRAARPRSALRGPPGRASAWVTATASTVATLVAAAFLSRQIVYWQSDTVIAMLRPWMP